MFNIIETLVQEIIKGGEEADKSTKMLVEIINKYPNAQKELSRVSKNLSGKEAMIIISSTINSLFSNKEIEKNQLEKMEREEAEKVYRELIFKINDLIQYLYNTQKELINRNNEYDRAVINLCEIFGSTLITTISKNPTFLMDYQAVLDDK
ncbi:hypothetical protein Bp8pS_232 [Bacillus phage vB_BpuM-BpSp]|nr:hypothetical protein Bp8pS_232 [Bacillus phage vB_BpuM-BpSp]